LKARRYTAIYPKHGAILLSGCVNFTPTLGGGISPGFVILNNKKLCFESIVNMRFLGYRRWQSACSKIVATDMFEKGAFFARNLHIQLANEQVLKQS
jgi:hypothetical protein